MAWTEADRQAFNEKAGPNYDRERHAKQFEERKMLAKLAQDIRRSPRGEDGRLSERAQARLLDKYDFFGVRSAPYRMRVFSLVFHVVKPPKRRKRPPARMLCFTAREVAGIEKRDFADRLRAFQKEWRQLRKKTVRQAWKS